MEQFDTGFKQVDVLPMVKHYMNELDLYNLFSKYVPASVGSFADHAESLCILIANIICENKPLYKVQEWVNQYSEGLVANPNSSGLFNDDRLARALSALYASDRHSLMTELSGKAIAVHNLLTEEIHNDTTTVTFIGKYDNPDPEAIKLKRGHNKDFRPDCKQLVFGLNITADGHVPLSYKLFDGNTNDNVTHVPNWNSLRTLLEKEDFIYVADCKLCSNENLTHIASNGGLFITIIPKNWLEVKKFYEHIKETDVDWEDAIKVVSSRRKSKINIYRTYEHKKTDEGFRVIFVHSSFKQEDEEKKRRNRIEKAIKKLEELSPKLNAYHLKTRNEIQDAIDEICKNVKPFIDVEIVTHRKQVKVYVGPGRRPKLETKFNFENKWDYKFSIKWEINNNALDEASKTDGLFPLITNTELSAKEVLLKYKSQPFIEKRMYTKKTVLEVAPVFLKKEKRIEAMLFLYFVSLMIVSLIERNIRINMEKQGIEKIPILPQGMNTKKPTWNNIRYYYRNVHLSQIFIDGKCIQTSVKGLNDLHEKINWLLEIPDIVYKNLKDDWWRFGCNLSDR